MKQTLPRLSHHKNNRMTPRLTIVKVGGKIVEQPELLDTLLREFAALDGPKILVHGGGRTATDTAARLGISTRMIDGRRVTDADMLRVVTMVYGGLVNKNVVACLQASGVNALGLTGADMDIIRSHRRPPLTDGTDYGFVGDIDQVNAPRLTQLLQAAVTPVIAPLTHNGKGSLLNTNADTIAASVARAMAPHYRVTLTYCFEHAGVLANPSDEESVIPLITPTTYRELKEREIVTGGMLPKIENALSAIQAGVARVVITSPDALSENCGTSIEPDAE